MPAGSGRNMSLLAAFEEVSGRISYPTPQAATLQERDGTVSLLVFDVPPLGLFDVTDVAAAADYFGNVLHVRAGTVITVAGERGTLGSHSLFRIVRTRESARLLGGRR
jgi:hypothetical protein